MSAIWKRIEEKEEGFTLIELLVVVIIIGILAAIAIPVFLNQRESAWRSSVESDVRNAAIEVETYYTQNRSYPDSLPDNVQISDDAIDLSYADASSEQSYCIQGDHDELSESIAYDSAEGGLQDWDTSCDGTSLE